MQNFKPSCYIQKEFIKTLNFSNTEVLKNKKEKSMRSYHLDRALKLGNLLKHKVNIYFKDVGDHLMRVNTTVWAVTEKNIILKQGIIIPRNRIVAID